LPEFKELSFGTGVKEEAEEGALKLKPPCRRRFP
jgi:hypothetical protein